MLRKYEILKSHQVPIAGLWIQDWVSKRMSLGLSRLWWNWELDHNHYDNWANMSEYLHRNNVKTLIYFNPMFSDPSTKENYRNNYYRQGNENNYFVKDKND